MNLPLPAFREGAGGRALPPRDLHLHQGPTTLQIQAWGPASEVTQAYAQATTLFPTTGLR